jgi:DNA mismatch repair protein MutS2
MEILEDSLADLEFKELLSEISSFCFTDEGKRRILSIKPITYFKPYSEAMVNIEYRHSQILKGKAIYKKIKVPLLDQTLIEIWRKTEKEGLTLLPKQIYGIYEFLRDVRDLLIFVDNLDNEFTPVKNIADSINVEDFYNNFSELESLIKSSIDRDGNILSTATPNLARIVSEKEKLELTIIRSLEEFIKSPENEEFLQDKFVTIRNNRFVIPVKMEYLNAIDGFVQDISSTGHTAFVEPSFIKHYSIKYIELVDEERTEIEKILRNITLQLRKFTNEIDLIIDVISEFDVLCALSKYADITNSTKPNLSQKPVIKLINARHPFLKNPVPITVELGNGKNDFGGLIISGPNTAGKTVSIKTIGLLTVMALSGLLIPSQEGSTIGYFNKILADIGDPQSIERDLSSFAAHIVKLKEIIELSNYNTLVIIDEIGTGTDPREGEALGVAILKEIASRDAKICVATHYTLIKKLPMSFEYFKNAYMEFDEETLKPTYKLIMGMPGSSNAMIIAKKLGMSDNIIEEAFKVMTEGIDIHEKFINELQYERREVEMLKEELQQKLKEIESLKKEYRNKIQEFEEKIEKVKKKEISDILPEITNLKKRISEIREKLINESISQKELEELNKELIKTSEDVNLPIIVERELIKVKNPQIGNIVFSGKFNMRGKISKIYPEGKVEVISGKIKIQTTIDDLYYPY